MGKKGVLIYASSSQCADLLYETSFYTEDPYLFFQIDKEKYIVVSSLEYERATLEAKKNISILDREELLLESKPKTIEALLEKIITLYPCEEWKLQKDFPYFLGAYLNNLKKNLSPFNIDNEVLSLLTIRKQKTKKELEELKKALLIAQEAMFRAETIINDSKINKKNELVYRGRKLTSEFIKGEINVVIAKNRASSHGTIVAHGKQGAIPHDTGSGIIRSSETIIIDIFPRLESSGYWGDITRTFIKGKVPELIKKAYHTVREIKNNLKTQAIAGTLTSTLQKNALEFFEKQGFKTGKINNQYFGFFHSLGHGIGLEVHELPNFSKNINFYLEKGDVFTLEPGLYYPDWGGIRLEDTIYINDIGKPECLTKYPEYPL